jgi:hypothetical protein
MKMKHELEEQVKQRKDREIYYKLEQREAFLNDIQSSLKRSDFEESRRA